MDLNFEAFNVLCHRMQESSYRTMSIVALCVTRMHTLHLKKSLQQFYGMDDCHQLTKKNQAHEWKVTCSRPLRGMSTADARRTIGCLAFAGKPT